jgi:hypothetical protein
MTDQQLLAAIQGDATAAALAAAGNDAGCAARLAVILPAVPQRYLPVPALIYWGALTGMFAKMAAAANAPSPVQSPALAFQAMVQCSTSPGLDTSDPAIVGAGGMLDAFTAEGVFNATSPGGRIA